jgi:UMP-CMP kinase
MRIKLACLIAFLAMLLSYKQRSLLLGAIKRVYSTRTKPIIVFAIGNPSTDKDTFIANLARDFDLQQVIIGPWLSSLRERQDKIGDLARRHWEKQVPMPASHLVPLLKAHVNELRDHGSNRFLIDGFPRTKESAELWEKKFYGPDITLYFETPQRRASAQYASVVRKRFDSVSGEDEQKLIQQRFEEHESEITPLMKYLERGERIVKVCFALYIHGMLTNNAQIAAPDDSNKSYAKVLDTLRNHPHNASPFKLTSQHP